MNLAEKIGDQAIILYQLFFIYNYMHFNNIYCLMMFILIFLNIIINFVTKKFFIELFKKDSFKKYNHRLPLLGSFCRPIDTKCEMLTMTGYGMPSGHSQIVSFLFAFYYFYYKNTKEFSMNIFLVYLAIALFVMYTRYSSGMHSIQQIILGHLYGILIGYVLAKGISLVY
jgi:membrane-associated phospholipid phosphatase